MSFDMLSKKAENRCDWCFDGPTFVPLLLWPEFFNYTQSAGHVIQVDMLHETPKIATPAVFGAKQIICYESKQSHAEAMQNLLAC